MLKLFFFFLMIEDNILSEISKQSANAFLDIYFIMSEFGQPEWDFFTEAS